LSVDRARCNALVTDATVVSRRCATSSAFQHSTSRRMSTALCRGGRCCSAATNARRIVSRCTANSSGLLFIGSAALFRADLAGVALQATDRDWSHGTGAPVRGLAQDLLLVLCGRRLPPGRLEGEAATRFSG
jgi:hypothetical protein